MDLLARLRALGVELPKAPPAVGAYASSYRQGDLLFVAGHTSRTVERPAHRGVVGVDVDIEHAAREARGAAINLLAAAHHAVGMQNVEALVHLRGFVRADPEFERQPAVIDGASLFFAEVFRETPRHARAAVGVASLPGGACVELEAVFAVRKG
ncbi:RidA family protein [Nocardioides daejeonensis]|uniref:RidA family protein n=1 Tax=Nocardioides daejeonensis TaxID=1046556 RepID=UPI000D745EE3|nr:RidA family protein [Nocardioides daejeonensis]